MSTRLAPYLGRTLSLCALALCLAQLAASSLYAAPTAQGSSAQPLMSVAEPEELRARYVFAVDLDGDGSDELLRATEDRLIAHSVKGGSLSAPRWSVRGPGQAHMIAPWQTASGLKLLIAWGVGPGMLKAPLSITELNPMNGAQRLVWRHEGPRSQAVHFELLSRDGQAAPAIRLAHFTSKYQTRALTLTGEALLGAWTAQSEAQLQEGPGLKLTERQSRSLRMGTSWAYADVDGDGVEEEVVGRVYGDKKGEFGELSLYRAGGAEPQVIPTERGVKAVYWAQWGGDEGRGAVYFSDGWVAEYGKRARARLKRLRWREGRPSVELLASSADDFTFFELWTHPQPGAPAGSPELLFARGNRSINLITPQASGPWRVERVAKVPPVVNAAVLYADGGWWAALPVPRKSLKLQPLKHPLLKAPPSNRAGAERAP